MQKMEETAALCSRALLPLTPLLLVGVVERLHPEGQLDYGSHANPGLALTSFHETDLCNEIIEAPPR